MLRIECDNQPLKKALTRLAEDVLDNGGFFHEALVLKAEDGNLSMASSLPAGNNEVLLRVPVKTFVPLDEVEFKLEGTDLAISKGQGKLTKGQRERLGIFLEIYNLTGKIQQYLDTNPRAIFRDDPEMLERVTAGRVGTGVTETIRKANTVKDFENYIIDGFFRTRNFDLEKIGKKNLIPLIDFTNHHSLAPRFKRQVHPERGFEMSLINSKIIPGVEECFARYGKWDNYDTYLMFGFSQLPIPFVRSIPLKLEAKGIGKIKVLSRIGARGKIVLPKPIRDLKFLFPSVRMKSKDEMVVSSLLIPNPDSPMALMRVLAELLTRLEPGIQLEDLKSHVASLEEKVVNENLNFYNDFLGYLETRKEEYRNVPGFRETVKMVKLQIRGIEEYREISLQVAQGLQTQAGTA